MRVLFLSRWFPYPPDNGSKIRIFNLLRQLGERFQVDLLSFVSEPVRQSQLAAMAAYCGRVETVPYRPFQPTRFGARLGYFSPHPRSITDTFSRAMQGRAESLYREHRYDLVIASQLDMVPYALGLPDRVGKLWEEVELTTLREAYTAERHPLKRLRRGLTWMKTRRYVRQAAGAFDGFTVVSGQEGSNLQRLCPRPERVLLVPNGVDLIAHQNHAEAPEPDSMIYAGALSYYANHDAVAFFVADVLPLIRARRPQARLQVTGSVAGVDLGDLLRHPGLHLTGYVPDVRPLVVSSWVSVVPLRVGGGTRLKILESLALGTPVVATRKGAEGLDLEPNRDLLLADTPWEFAAAALAVMADPDLRARLGQQGRSTVSARYDWRSIGRTFCDFAEATVAAKRAGQL